MNVPRKKSEAGRRAPAKRSAARRRGERDDFRELAEVAPFAIMECGADGRVTFANSRAVEYFGWTQADLKRGVNIWDSLVENDMPRAIDKWERIVSGDRSRGAEYTMRRKDGSTFPAIICVAPIKRGERVVGSRGILIDISERKRSEEALRESEERFRSIIEKGTAIFYMHDPDHHLTYLSPQFERILGYEPAEALARWTDFLTNSPANRRAVELTERAIETGERQLPYETEFVAKDGRRIWFEVDEAPVVRDGKTIAIVGAAMDVTERKKSQQELRELGAVVHCTSEIVNLISLDGEMIFLNEAGGRLFGIPPGEARDFRIDDVIAPPHRDLVRSSILPALMKGEPWEGDLRVRNVATGKRFDVHTLAFAILDRESGAPLHFAAVSRDITERKRAADALREREAKLDSIFRAAPIGIGVVMNRVILEINDKICDMTGYSREELVGQSARLLYATDQEFEFVGFEKYRQIAACGSGAVETRWRRKDGRMIDICLSSAPLVAGGLSHGVTFTALDITERRRGEDALRESEKKYRQLIEMLQEGIWAIDAGGRTTFVNPRMAEMLGYPVEEMVGKHLFSFMDDAAAKECRRLLDRRFSGVREQHDFEFLRKDGTRLFARVETAPIADENGAIVGAIAGVQDQTERMRAEEQRRSFEAQIRESQKLESLGVLAGGVAHDFNNILLAIQGNLELAVGSLPPDAPSRQSLAEVERASKRAADLCRQLLAYSGKGHFVIGSLDLARIVQETAQMLSISISKKAELRIELPPRVPLVEADETQIKQVIMNLIINASESLGDGSGEIGVSMGVVECDRAQLNGMINGDRLPEGGYVYLDVSDTGCGMDRETIGRIFDPFFSTKSAGRGLGLSATLGIMRGHGGAIEIRSAPGEGTSFRLLFPASTSTGEHVEEVAGGSEGWRGSGTVLLVDDEEMVRSVAKRMLEHLGFDVVLASNGVEAVEICRARCREIACVILDLTMPHMNGIETLAALRRCPADVKVILSSGYSGHELTKRFAGEGFSGFIEKPYRLSELAERLRSVLAARSPI